MTNLPPSSPRPVPAINIYTVDDTPTLLGSDMFYTFCDMVPDYPCSGSLPEYNINSSDLDDIPELSHLNTTTSRPFMTGSGYSLPYSPIAQENVATVPADGCLTPSSFDGSFPSPASSFTSSLSPASYYDPLGPSDSESAVSPSPATPDHPFCWPTSDALHSQSNDSLVLPPSLLTPFPNESVLPDYPLGYSSRRRSRSTPSARREPVASKAMLEANSRRRRHPPQFYCGECQQTFTALFSLKRHQQSHTGQRPFKCSIPGCEQRFYNSSDCKRHEKSKKRHKDLQ